MRISALDLDSGTITITVTSESIELHDGSRTASIPLRREDDYLVIEWSRAKIRGGWDPDRVWTITVAGLSGLGFDHTRHEPPQATHNSGVRG